MEKWEYMTRFFEAKASDREIKQFIKEAFDKRPRPYSPEAMIPELNALGEEGWEIIHMEPVANVGGKEDVLVNGGYRWSNVYFCVMKRRKPGSWVPMMPATYGQTQQKAPEASDRPASAPNPEKQAGDA